MLAWRDDESFEIGAIEYACRPTGRRFRSEPGHFCLLKARGEVEQYEQLLHHLESKRIVEVGTYDGASAALFAEITQPEKLVTIDRRSTPSEALTHFIATRGLGKTVSAYCGVDQANARRLREILDAEFDGEPIDLVVDDASHLVEPTRATFNCLFPRLRAGGAYVIEDWSWAHTATVGPWLTTDETPLTVFVFELVMACAHLPKVVSNVNVFGNIVLITRGAADLDPAGFDVSNCYGARGGALLARPEPIPMPSRRRAQPGADLHHATSGPWVMAARIPRPDAASGARALI